MDRSQAGWVGFLKRFGPWALYVTLTVEHERSASQLWYLAHRYLAVARAVLTSEWWWVFVVEEGELFQRPHVHLLVGGLDDHDLAVEAFRTGWTTNLLGGRTSPHARPLGLLTVDRYDSRRRGLPYTVKQLAFDREWDIDPEIEGKVACWHERRRKEARSAGRLRALAGNASASP